MVAIARERNRFLKFLVVGVIGAVIDFGTFNLLTSVFHVLPVLSSVISFIAAVISNFLWNRYWTYPDSRSKQLSQQIVQFGAVSLAGLLIRTPIFALLEPRLIAVFSRSSLPRPITATLAGHNLALASAILVVLLWNFFVNRFWTYSDVE